MIKFTFTIIISVLLYQPSFAVEQLYHSKKNYTDDQGKVYYATKEVQLFSEQFIGGNASQLYQGEKKYISLSNIGANKYSNLNLDKNNSQITIYYDPIPPVVTFEYPKLYKKELVNYSNKPVTIKINAIDTLSGIDTLYISKNKSEYIESDNFIHLDQNGDYELLFYATDNVGNVSVPRVLKFVIDDNPPQSELVVTPYQVENEGKIVVTRENQLSIVASTNSTNLKTSYYQLDNGKILKYKTPISLRNFSKGKHTISFYSVDNLGNEESLKNVDFYIDLTAPSITHRIVGSKHNINNKEYISLESKIELISIDDMSGTLETLYQLNNGDQQLYREPFVASNDKISQSLSYWAIDNVGNNSKKISFNYSVDQDPPSVDIKFDGKSFKETPYRIYINDKTKVSLTCKDDLTGVKSIEYSINDNTYKIFNSPLEFMSNKTSNLKVVCIDNVINNSEPKEYEIISDLIQPEFTYQFDKPKITNRGKEGYNLKTKLFLIANDNSSGIDKITYRVNSGKPKEYFKSLTFLKSGDYRIEVEVVDNVGNISKQAINTVIYN